MLEDVVERIKEALRHLIGGKTEYLPSNILYQNGMIAAYLRVLDMLGEDGLALFEGNYPQEEES